MALDYLQLTGEERVRELISQFSEQVKDPEDREWTKNLFPSLTVHSVSTPDAAHPSVTFRFTVQPQHCNRLNNLHGGCTASLFDFCTSTPLALIARPGFWSFLGVSRTLNTTYLRPAPAGTEVLVECEIVQVGQRLCALRGTLRRASDGTVLATCEHNKVNTDPGVAKV
ncbi:HotDog domain-containing protein [Chaetomidium leptoderma]|uniref:HotDog domain-containing protein n=1 Tax=Chaetomidium leptoderma TaxID=669021 RepID=A0AAN7A0F4_9PEZI|nr:HotDog domain-containing protein [Chaetomidium leptoderma]